MADAFVGEIRLFPYAFAPNGWALCDGQLLPVQRNTTLFAVIGNRYGGDGATTFGLPDLRSRAAMGSSNAQSTGVSEGVEQVALTGSTTPNHTHSLNYANVAPAAKVGSARNDSYLSQPVYQADGSSAAAGAAAFASSTSGLVPLNPQTLGMTGAGEPHENRQPFLAMGYFISLQGVFPQRS